jgi:hypothetical protein
MEAVTPTTDTRTFAQMALRLAVVERAPSGLYDAKGRPIREKGFRSDVDFRRQIWVRTEATWRALVRTERP